MFNTHQSGRNWRFLLSLTLVLSGIFFLVTASAKVEDETNLKIHISKIRSTKGTIRICVYKDSDSFDNDKPYRVKIVKKEGLKDGKLTAEIQVQPGACGIAILDDENNNQKMDYGMIMPNEGFGFSGYFHSGMSRPKFPQFKFNALAGKENNTYITVKYY